MAKPQPAADPSVEEMLSTIRQAIDEETAKTVQDPARQAAVSGSMREMRVSLQPPGPAPARPAQNKPAPARPTQQPPAATTRVTGSGKPFAGIMGGDVRLEEALARLQRAERLQEKNQPPVAPPMAPRPSASASASANLPPRPQRTYHTAPAPLTGTVGQPHVRSANPPSPAAPVARPLPEPPAQPARTLEATQPLPPAEAALQPAPIQSALDPLRNPDAETATPQSARPCQPTAAAPARQPGPPGLPGLMSGTAERAATDAFARLSEEVLMRSLGGNDRLAENARDMLRPMLKSWLDQNLPALVEKLVREEIERVVRRGGH